MTENEQSRAVPVEDSNIEQEAVLLQNKLSVLENNYKRSQKETLVTEALFSHWSSDQHVTIDSNDKVMQLELELSYTKTVSYIFTPGIFNVCVKYVIITLTGIHITNKLNTPSEVLRSC